jgi:phosphopantetheinyl transferase (holo-ACP synthase)
MNRYVNVGIGLNTTVESLQKHLCHSNNSRDVSNENRREKFMTMKRLNYLSMHCDRRTVAQTWAALEACPSKLPCNPLHCFPIVLALVQLAPPISVGFHSS